MVGEHPNNTIEQDTLRQKESNGRYFLNRLRYKKRGQLIDLDHTPFKR